MSGLRASGRGARMIGAGLVAVSVTACAFGQTEIRGRILTEDGRPVAYALVGVHLSSVDGPVAQTESHGATADSGGWFSATGLNGGPYWICVNVPRSELLDPCAWSTSPPLIRVAAGQVSAGNEIRLVKGGVIRVRVEDLGLRVATPYRQRAGGFLQAGVFGPGGLFIAAAWMSSDRRGHDYEVRVPVDTDVEVAVRTEGLQVLDDKGKGLTPATRIAVRVPKGGGAKKVDLRVAGGGQ